MSAFAFCRWVMQCAADDDDDDNNAKTRRVPSTE